MFKGLIKIMFKGLIIIKYFLIKVLLIIKHTIVYKSQSLLLMFLLPLLNSNYC